MSARGETLESIQDTAQRLIQERGYNAFSYADISRELGIRNASIHYYFPAKADLGTSVVQRYRQRLAHELGRMAHAARSAPELLTAYLHSYRGVVHLDGRICLCVSLAGELLTLPEDMQREVRAFIDLNQSWLADVFEQGRAAGTLHFSGTSQDMALAFLAALHGAMLLSRALGDVAHFERSGEQFIATVAAP